MNWIEVADKHFKVALEELRIWREKHPREAADVHEEALAKIEKRAPNYAPPRMFG